MILSIKDATPQLQEQKMSWQDQIRTAIYIRNKLLVKQTVSISQNQPCINGLKHFMSSNRNCIQLKFQHFPNHHWDSVYIPLQACSFFHDEFHNTFPIMHKISENNQIQRKAVEYQTISYQLSYGKQKQCLTEKWTQCLKSYILKLDLLQKITVYLALVKEGFTALNKAYTLYQCQCLKTVFLEEVRAMERFFNVNVTNFRDLDFTIQINTGVNQSTMPMTMKQLFCSICMIYDCCRHQNSDNLCGDNQQYDYQSAKNYVTKQKRFQDALRLCSSYQMFLFPLNIVLDSKSSERTKQEKIKCSKDCYKVITADDFHELKLPLQLISSSVLKGLLNMGLEMFSFDPCKIKSLFLQKNINCSVIFKYLLETINIFDRLQWKMYSSQEQYLFNQKQIQMPLTSGIIKHKNRTKKQDPKISDASICAHYYTNKEPKDINCLQCVCIKRGYCLPECFCSTQCPIRLKGCSCKQGTCTTQKCQCHLNNSECDPLICKNCRKESHYCKNNDIILGKRKRILVGKSTIRGAGLGAFAGENIHKKDLITTYTGEMIVRSIEEMRQNINVDNSFYNFDYLNDSIDSKYMGNKSRFINHGNQGQDNVEARIIFSRGICHVAFYAIRNIAKHEELLFDYDGNGELYNNHHHKYPFIKQKN